jgi:uncharacterized protein DUF3152
VPEPTRPRLATMPREDRVDVPDAGRAIRHTASSYDAGGLSSSYPAGPSGGRSRGRLRRFVREYGWRAYALPLLIVITIVALMRMNEPGGPPGPASAAGSSGASLAGAGPPRAAPTDTPMMPDKAGAAVQREVLASDALPPGGPYTQRGKGTFHVVPGTGPVVGTGALHRYTIDIEDGVTGINPATFATTVQAALDNPQSWTGHGSGVALQRVDSGPVEFHITLTSAMTVRALCGYELKIETSCYAAAHDQRVVLNVARWIRGDMAYVGDLATYHLYMVDHESGHALGHSHAHACLKNGFAPVMMQQTISLKAANGKTCQANPWPYPPGASDAPGVEQPGT